MTKIKENNGIAQKSQQHLLADIRAWINNYEKRTGANHVRRLLNDFLMFSEDYFKEFERRLSENNQDKDFELEKAINNHETTAEHVRYQALQVILDEWTIISRIVEQHLFPKYKNRLSDIDITTQKYLPGKWNDSAGVISYLGKANVIRHNVYSAVAVASVPRYLYPSEDCEMAGPHEIGHYVFWNLTDSISLPQKHKDLREKAKTKSKEIAIFFYSDDEPIHTIIANMMNRWVEEIFADIYGIFVAGPSFCWSLINILSQQIGNKTQLLEDDHDHPFPYLRPLMLIHILNYMLDSGIPFPGSEDKAEQQIKYLKNRWDTFLWDITGKSDREIREEEKIVEIDNIEEIGIQKIDIKELSPHRRKELSLICIIEALFYVAEYLLSIVTTTKCEEKLPVFDRKTAFNKFKSLLTQQSKTEDIKQPEYKRLLCPLSKVFAHTSDMLDKEWSHNLCELYWYRNEQWQEPKEGDYQEHNEEANWVWYRFHTNKKHSHNLDGSPDKL